MQSIRVLVMGGTIDNLEYHSLDDAPMHQHSVIGDLLAMAHVTWETAKYLKKRMKKKTIVLTGAMVMPRESTSDAHFNLGYALCAAQHLPHGVYVAMNGTIFDARNVRKNVEEKIFEHKKPC
ncbi:asparaginase [Candidatus Peregrinibacteria bacterium]|nr:asparaginase [Candidatus Peregrinibacteria bacterium]